MTLSQQGLGRPVCGSRCHCAWLCDLSKVLGVLGLEILVAGWAQWLLQGFPWLRYRLTTKLFHLHLVSTGRDLFPPSSGGWKCDIRVWRGRAACAGFRGGSFCLRDVREAAGNPWGSLAWGPVTALAASFAPVLLSRCVPLEGRTVACRPAWIIQTLTVS